MNFNTEKFVSESLAKVMAAFPEYETTETYIDRKSNYDMGFWTAEEFSDIAIEEACQLYGRENVYAAVCATIHQSKPTFNFLNSTNSMAVTVTCDTEEEAWSVINPEYRKLYRLEFVQNPS